MLYSRATSASINYRVTAMPKGGRREGAGRPPVPTVGAIVRLDELTAWRLNRLAARSGTTPRDYLRDAIYALYDAALDTEAGAAIVVDKAPD